MPAPMPSPLPVVDVVIATHNRPELVRKAIDAVWCQTYRGPIECVVVFDKAEPDHSLERSAPGRRVRVMRNDRSPGLAGARNSGVLSGAAPYVAFCDDDDEWKPIKLERQIDLMERSTALTAVTGITVEYGDRTTDRVPRPADMTVEALVRRRVMEAHPSSVLVRRTAFLDDIGLVDEEIPGSHGEDYDWIIRAAQAGEIAVVEAPLVRVLWGQSMFSRRWQTIIDATDYTLRKHRAFHESPTALARMTGQRAFALAALGRRQEALAGAVQTVRASPREPRAYLAVAVATRVVSAERLMNLANRRGRGI